jgi:hypothetical protein
MKKNPGGRPKLPKGKAKGDMIGVRLLKAERRQVEAAAKRDGKRLSEWVRIALLAAAKQPTIKGANTEDAGIEPHGVVAPGLGM